MKGYRWSNGETVDAQDVVFWMNMVKADATSWAGYVPGPGQFPGDITNVVANNKTDTVTFTLDATYSSYWFTYNELSQITPLPIAWDITVPAAAGSGGCSSASYTSIDDLDLAQRRSPRLRLREGLRRGARLPHGQDRGGRSRHLRHEPALAGRRRTVPPDPVRRDRQRRDRGTEPRLLGTGQVVAQRARAGPVHDRRRRVQRAAERQAPSASATSHRRTCRSTRARPSARTEHRSRGRTTLTRGQLQPRAGVPLGRQLLRPQLHEPDLGPDLQAAVHPSGDAVADEPDPVDPAVQRRLRRPDLRSGARLPADRPGHAAGELQPVPLQPFAREVAADLARLEGRPERCQHLCEAGNQRPTSAGRGSQRARS